MAKIELTLGESRIISEEAENFGKFPEDKQNIILHSQILSEYKQSLPFDVLRAQKAGLLIPGDLYSLNELAEKLDFRMEYADKIVEWLANPDQQRWFSETTDESSGEKLFKFNYKTKETI